MTVDELLEAERTLEGDELLAAQLEYLRTDGVAYSWPGAFHEAEECTVCDSRRRAMAIDDATA